MKVWKKANLLFSACLIKSVGKKIKEKERLHFFTWFQYEKVNYDFIFFCVIWVKVWEKRDHHHYHRYIASSSEYHNTDLVPRTFFFFCDAGYIVPGGVASACGDDPWMLTLLGEVKGLRDSGRCVRAHAVSTGAGGGWMDPCPCEHRDRLLVLITKKAGDPQSYYTICQKKSEKWILVTKDGWSSI